MVILIAGQYRYFTSLRPTRSTITVGLMSCGYSKTLDFGRGFLCTEIAPKMVKTIIPIINLLRTCISKEVVQEALSNRIANSPIIL